MDPLKLLPSISKKNSDFCFGIQTNFDSISTEQEDNIKRKYFAYNLPTEFVMDLD
jgi:hypothetical protein